MALKYISASQIKLFKRCPVRWAHVYLNKVREPGSNATRFGTVLHDTLEGYLLNDAETLSELEEHKENFALRRFPLIQDAISKGFLPDTSKPEKYSVELETNLHLSLDGFCLFGVPSKGFIDLYEYCAELNYCRITDHKSFSKPETLQNEYTLATDTQMMIYAAFALFTNPSLDTVHLRHLQYPSAYSIEVREVCVEVSRADVAAEIEKLSTVIEQMKAIEQQVSELPEPEKFHTFEGVEGATKNKFDCRAFGRICTFRSNGMCPLPEIKRIGRMNINFSEMEKKSDERRQRTEVSSPENVNAPDMPLLDSPRDAPAPKLNPQMESKQASMDRFLKPVEEKVVESVGISISTPLSPKEAEEFMEAMSTPGAGISVEEVEKVKEQAKSMLSSKLKMFADQEVKKTSAAAPTSESVLEWIKSEAEALDNISLQDKLLQKEIAEGPGVLTVGDISYQRGFPNPAPMSSRSKPRFHITLSNEGGAEFECTIKGTSNSAEGLKSWIADAKSAMEQL